MSQLNLILILVGCVLFLAGLPLVILLFTRRRQAVIAEHVRSAWRGTVTGFEHGTIRIQQHGVGDGYPLYVEVLYRRDDGVTGSIKVPEDRGGTPMAESTLQPMPAAGMYDEVQTQWAEGDRIEKPAGAYYPVRVLR